MSAELVTPPTTEQPTRGGRGRSTAVWMVLVLAGLLLLLSAFAIWIDRVALNTTVFTETSSELLDNDRIRGAVANRAVDELFANVDVQAEIEEQLPEDYKGLSGAATAGLRQASYQIVERALEEPIFQELFRISLRQSHETLVQVLEGGGSRVTMEGGVVTLELGAIVQEAAERIGVGQQVADRLPEGTGQIVVLRSNELDTAQNVFQLLNTLAWLLPIVTLLAFGLAVWLAGERRHAVRGAGITLVTVGLVGLVAASLARSYVVGSLVAREDDREAAGDAWSILTDLLRGSFRLMIVLGILFLVAAWLAGPSRRALGARGWLAPALQERVWGYVGLGAVVLLLLFTAQVTDFARVLAVAVLAGLGAIWIELMRRQTLREFPAARGSTVVADTRARVTGWWETRRAAAAARNAPSGAGQPPATDLSARLASLAELHRSGELTDEEYASAKARVLAGE